MARILITHGVPAARFALLKPHEVIYPGASRAFHRDELLTLLPTVDVVLACGAMDRELMQAAQRVQLIVCYGAGYDSIDLAAASEMGIPVVNVPDSVTEATAELAMGLILAVTRQIALMDRGLRAQEDTRALFTMGREMGVSVEGMTLGIVGMGRIGGRVAEFGRFLRMRVLYTSREIKPFSVAGNARRLPLDQLLSASDVVSLHCPLTPQTEGLLSREAIARMRSTAFLVNTARGKLVDELALTEALEQRQIAGAALDVFATEPQVSERLRALPNVVLTPHIGSNTLRTRNTMAEQCCQRMLEALAGRRPQNLLNPEAWPRR